MKNIKTTIAHDAAAIHPADVKELTFDLKLVKHNAMLGLAAVEKHSTRLAERYKKYKSAKPRLLELLVALEVAAHTAVSLRPVDANNRSLRASIYGDRELLVTQLQLFARSGLVAVAEVERIKAGRGSIDAAQDIVDAVALLDRYPAARSKLVTSAAQLKQMVENAKLYLSSTRRAAFHSNGNEAYAAALDTQSRVWTLVLQQHEQLWKYGCEIYGKAVDEHVLPLGSRVVNRKKKTPVSPAEPPTPSS